MSRYQACRLLGLGPVTAAAIAAMNWLAGVPDGLIRFMTLEVEYPAARTQEGASHE